MERIIIEFLIFLLFTNFEIIAENTNEFRGKKIYKFPFYIFSYKVKESPFALSGYCGDVNNLRVEKVKDSFTGSSSLKIIYIPQPGRKDLGWAGLYYQSPPNNWGDNEKGGFDLSDAKYLYFSCRGARGDEIIEVKIGGIKGKYGDSCEISTGYVTLKPYWVIYRINLKDENLKNIIGGFGIFFSYVISPYKTEVYLNEIFYSEKEEPENNHWIDLIKKYNQKIFSWR